MMKDDIIWLGYRWHYINNGCWSCIGTEGVTEWWPVYIHNYYGSKYVVSVFNNIENTNPVEVCTTQGVNLLDLIYLFSSIRLIIDNHGGSIQNIMNNIYYIEHDEEWMFKGVDIDGAQNQTKI